MIKGAITDLPDSETMDKSLNRNGDTACDDKRRRDGRKINQNNTAVTWQDRYLFRNKQRLFKKFPMGNRELGNFYKEIREKK